jgi:hypothetical protein
MLPSPGADLCGVTELLKDVVITGQHELTQPLPGAAFDVYCFFEDIQINRLAIKMADTVLTDDREIPALEPFTGKHCPITIQQETLLAVDYSPTARSLNIQYSGGPATRD